MARISRLIGEHASSNYYYFPHVSKQDYDRAFNDARLWALENPTESPRTAARIHHVKEEALRKSVGRSQRKQRNSQGVYNQHGGNNKIMDTGMEEAVRQYCYEQWEAGLGASHGMVYASICFLRAVKHIVFFFNIY
jgi:hypothetical protein